jgi:hypothetical protein
MDLKTVVEDRSFINWNELSRDCLSLGYFYYFREPGGLEVHVGGRSWGS